MSQLETALTTGTRWVLVVAGFSLALFAIPSDLIIDHLLAATTVHLIVLVVVTTMLGYQLGDLLERPFFTSTKRPWLLSAASFVALATGFAALVTLASSAVLGYDPSLQLLQLLSALDVAWTAVGLGLGVRYLTNSKTTGLIAALMLDAICVFSIWNYLRVVGFGPEGQWIVDNGRLATLVIPFDIAAAVMTVTALTLASRRLDTPHSRPGLAT